MHSGTLSGSNRPDRTFRPSNRAGTLPTAAVAANVRNSSVNQANVPHGNQSVYSQDHGFVTPVEMPSGAYNTATLPNNHGQNHRENIHRSQVDNTTQQATTLPTHSIHDGQNYKDMSHHGDQMSYFDDTQATNPQLQQQFHNHHESPSESGIRAELGGRPPARASRLVKQPLPVQHNNYHEAEPQGSHIPEQQFQGQEMMHDEQQFQELPQIPQDNYQQAPIHQQAMGAFIDSMGVPRITRDEDWDDFGFLEDFEATDNDELSPEADIPVPRIRFKPHNYYYQACYCGYIISLIVYIYIRLTLTLDAPGLNRIYCTFVAILEIITCPSMVIQGMTLWKWKSRPEPPPDAFLTPKFHTVRIFVPTYKEPLDVVGPTIHEILHMDVPPGMQIQVYVLDDGRREYMDNYVRSLRSKKDIFLHYVGRPKLEGIPHHAKAGNINHTLRFIYDHGKTEGEAIVIFDADFMPRRNYLLRVLPVFSEKRHDIRPIGLVQTPQFFFNVNPDEDVWDHLNVSFFHRIEPSLDQWSSVNCCGTNFTVRADALRDVGYFPVGCLTEDTLLSLRLCTMGWAVTYHHEVLAIGQSPHEITEIFKQRSRWCKGNLQIFCDEMPLTSKGLTWPQRILYSSCGYNYFCASVSIPFFQLVPSWAIFFGLWPVSSISLEFATSFFVYYLLGNLLLLWPPDGFSVKDMWNGELASTNLWYTYFNGVRRIIGAKLLSGNGELTFKSTKKKSSDEEEDDGVGFQKDDLRACYMHFIMFFIMLITIIYAIARAVMMQDVKFYYYYMYMIGMSWALINMIPYLIVVIYCWYRVRIPGLVCACLRNIQLLLRAVCGVLILIQAWTTRNLTENFQCPHPYTAEIGRSPLTMVRTIDELTGLEIERNAFWLLGLKDDFYTIQQIKRSACEEDSIPIIVFFMHPSSGLALDEEAGHYMPVERILTWEQYADQIKEYAEQLADVPSIIVMEPSLLMHTFNTRTEYHNTQYQFEYSEHVRLTIQSFPRSWVYVDAGNALYLQWKVNMDHIVGVLNNMPDNLRGFSINVGSFVNTSFNTQLAMEVHCQTGLNFIVDTSRNGGLFSERSMDEINECTYDPPYIDKGAAPGWSDGATRGSITRKEGGGGGGESYAGYGGGGGAGGGSYGGYGGSYGGYDYAKRKKRNAKRKKRSPWRFIDSTDAGGGGYENTYGYDAYGAEEDAYADYGDTYDTDYAETYGIDEDVLECITTSQNGGQDATAWVKTPGEADGRIFNAGTYNPCLIGHAIECSDQCPQYVPKMDVDEYQRVSSCECG